MIDTVIKITKPLATSKIKLCSGDSLRARQAAPAERMMACALFEQFMTALEVELTSQIRDPTASPERWQTRGVKLSECGTRESNLIRNIRPCHYMLASPLLSFPEGAHTISQCSLQKSF